MTPVFEHLERRQLLTTLYVNDNWVVTNDPGNDGYSEGDTVANSGFGDNGLITGLTVYGPGFTSGTAFNSITDALGVATSGDTIRVISGTYSPPSAINVNVAGVTLQGDNFGTAGTGTRVNESVLNGPIGSLNITAANVTIDGFLIRDSLISSGTGVTVGAVAGAQIKNNIIRDNVTGVTFGAGSSNFTVDRNLFDSNNRAGATRGQGVRVLANTGTGTITNNTFTGHTPAASVGSITLVGSTGVSIGTASNGNIFTSNALDVRIAAGTTSTSMTANTFNASSTTYIDHSAATELNASGNTFGGVNPNGNTNVTQQYAIVDKIVDGVDISGRGLVRINSGHVYVTPNSFSSPTTTTPDVQRAVALGTAGNVIHIQAGSYTGSVTTSGTNLTLSPGASTGIVTITGNLTLDSNDTLFLELNGLTPGTGHDQLVVNGVITLGSAILSTTGSTLTSVAGNQVTLLSNDLVDAVNGNFAGALNGGNVTVNGEPYIIFYNGGTGNDVVLVRVPAAAPPAIVYVDDNWVGATNGTDQDGVGPGTAFGFDQFADIQSAIDAVVAGGTIHVAAGGYVQNIIVDKAVSILGPNAAIAGNGVRVGEAVVRPELSEPDPTQDPTSVIFYITASGVTIKGLTIDGDNTSIVSGLSRNGADIDAIEGVASYEGIGNTTIQNNIVKNFSFTGIDFSNTFNGGAATSGNTISGNLVTNIGGAEDFIGYGAGAGVGILIQDNFYANVTGNQLSQVIVGIQTGNFYLANPGVTGSISTNIVSAERIGLFINGLYNLASTMTVSGNTITGFDDDNTYTHWDGFILSSIEGAVDVTISGNDIDGSGITKLSTGFGVWNVSTSALVSIVGGTVEGVDLGIHANNYATFNANSPGATTLTVDGVDINASSVGIYAEDDVLNTNGSDVTVTVTGGTEVQGATIGVGIFGPDATGTIQLSNIHDNQIGVSINGTLATVSGNQIVDNDTGLDIDSTVTGSLVSENIFSNSSFDILVASGTTATAVKIAGNSLEGAVAVRNDSAAIIQASNNWWGTTLNPETAGRISGTNAAGVDYSPWMHTNLDLDLDPTNGYQGFSDVLGVDDDSPQSTYLSAGATLIAEAFATVEDGGTLVIYTGSYTENVVTSGKSVALTLGETLAQVTINGSLTLDSNDVLVIDAVGTNPATQYDNIIVTGTATLGGALLNTNIAYLPGPSDVLTVIDATTLTGTFSGLPQGAFLGSGFRIDYNAGLANVRFVQNTPSVVAEANGPYNINEGQNVTLSSAGSFDPDAFLGDNIVSYSWDLNNDNVFGDVTGATPTVSWATLQSFGINDGNANYTIKLKVTNNLGETGTDTATISVTNVTPTIAVTGASSSNEGSTYSLTLGPVIDPGADTIANYRINWGDATTDTYTAAQILGFGGVVKHVYVDDNPTGTTSDPYTINVSLQDEDNTPSYYTNVTSKTITVNNVAPAPTIVGAPVNSPEGTSISLSVNPNDVGVADTFSYSWVVTQGVTTIATGTSASITFIPADGPSSVTVNVTVTDDDGSVGNQSKTISITNVAPTIAVTGAASSNEGSNYTLTLGAITDPGPDTVTDYFINWGDGSPADHYTTAQVVLAGGVFTHLYDDGPVNRTISVNLTDEDATHVGAGTKIVHINNLDPTTGGLINGGPVNQGEDGVVTWQTPSDPSTNDAGTLLFDYDFNNDGTYDLLNSPLSSVTVPGIYLVTVGPHTITSRMHDNDGLLADGAAQDGVVVLSTSITVNAASFRVLPGGFTAKPSGFTVKFNKPASTGVLNLYDGDDAPIDASDVIVIGALNPGNPVKGSLVWDSATNTATWVATGGVLANDSYTVTLVSGANAWTAGGVDHLDGNADGTSGDNYSTVMAVSSSTRAVTMPDFARGSGQTVKLPLDNTAGATLPISVTNAAGVTSVDFQLFYNPQLLNITALAKATGVPGDWSISSNLGTPIILSATLWQVNVTVSGITALGAGTVPVVAATANVPNAAAYGDTNLIRIENVVVNGLAGRGDYAIHKNVYVGDANGNGAYTGADSGLISGVVVGPTTGFDAMGLIDPAIIADVDANGLLQGQDASWVAQKSLSPASRPEIPNVPGLVLVLGTGVDPTIDAGEVIGGPGNTVIVPLNITDNAAGLVGFNVIVNYDKNKLSLVDDISFASTSVTLGQLFTDATGWTMLTDVDQANGKVTLAFFRSSGTPAGTGSIVDLHFTIAPAATGVVTITPSGLSSDGGFSFSYVTGNVTVDSTGPAAPVMSFNYNNGFPMNITAAWAENVSGSKTMTLTNLTTASGAPVTLVYSPNTGTYTFPSFGNGILPNGNYQAVISAASVTDQYGNPMASNVVFNFFVLGGDANRDRKVDVNDLVALSNNWLQPGTFSQGDFNYDGFVDQADLGILSQNWQQVLNPPAAPPLASPTSATTTTSQPAQRPAARTATRVSASVINLVQ